MATQEESLVPTPLEKQRNRAERARPRRYEPTPVYALAEHLKQEGVELQKVRGPWRPIRRSLRRPGRKAERAIPIVTNGVTELAVDTAERAADVSGLLNWCGIDRLDPIPNLRPPRQDLAAS
jgi:hypothetical protein